MFLCLGRLGFNYTKDASILQDNVESPELPEPGTAPDTGSDIDKTASAHGCSISTFSRTLRDLFLLIPPFLCLQLGPFAAVAALHPQPDQLLLFVSGQIPWVSLEETAARIKTQS